MGELCLYLCKGAFWLLHCHGDLSMANGSGLDWHSEDIWSLVACYVDDAVIATPTLPDFIDRLEEFLTA